jgi:transposase
MTNLFRPYSQDQRLLLPPDMREWLPEGDLALFLSDVVDALDLSAIYRAYERVDGRGQAAYHPALMVKLLMYGYCTGVPSSRKLEQATYRDVAFRVLAGDQHPDHDSIAAFRQRHLEALADLFGQVLRLCQGAGLVKVGHIALDGTKIKANASKHKAMSYARMEQTEARLAQEVRTVLEEAERVDAAEDAEYGRGRRGDELPAELARRESRLAAIRAAKAALEAEAQAKAGREAAAAQEKVAAQAQREGSAKGRPVTVPDPAQARPAPTAQYNFTDPESRIMKDGATKAFEQAYNAQIAVDGHAQVIVACELTQAAADVAQLLPLLHQIEVNTGQRPAVLLADAGYFSEPNITIPQTLGIDVYIPPDRGAHGAPERASAPTRAPKSPVAAAMREKLATAAGRALYALRKSVVEPVFGQTKEVRRFRRFALRGLIKVCAEWRLICLTHNLLKLYRAAHLPAS